MKKLFLAASALALLSAPSFAGNANFGGWYGGVNVGAVNHHSDTTDIDYYENGATFSVESFGGTLGLQLGHNWQSGMIVYGLEASANYIAADESVVGDDNYDYIHDPDWQVTLLGRAGIVSEDTMLYLAAGAAVLQSNNRWADNGSGVVEYADADGFEFGLVYGFGLEHAVNDKSSVKVEVLQGQFGDQTQRVINDSDYKIGFDNENTLVRVGYNWKFNM